MSWGVARVGTKAAIRQPLLESFDKAAEYQSDPEEKADVIAARDRAIAVVDSFVPNDTYNGLFVEASGSRYSGCMNINCMNIKIDIRPVKIES